MSKIPSCDTFCQVQVVSHKSAKTQFGDPWKLWPGRSAPGPGRSAPRILWFLWFCYVWVVIVPFSYETCVCMVFSYEHLCCRMRTLMVLFIWKCVLPKEQSIYIPYTCKTNVFIWKVWFVLFIWHPHHSVFSYENLWVPYINRWCVIPVVIWNFMSLCKKLIGQ